MSVTRAGYVTFIRDKMGINSTVLPTNSTDIDDTLALAQDIVSNLLAMAISENTFSLVTYNLAGHILIEYASDVVPNVVYKNGLPFFAYWRETWKINSFTPGIVASTSDEGTSTSLLNPEFLSKLSMSDLQYVKTPYGRFYMGYAQRVGMDFGIS